MLRLIAAARRQVEALTHRRLITQKWRLYFDGFPAAYYGRCGDIVLFDVAPVSTIDAVKYIDSNGALATLASTEYQLVAEAPARVALAYGKSWPSMRGDRDGVRVEVTCGYGLAATVPEDIKAAILLLIGHLFDHRSDVDLQLEQMPSGSMTLLSPYMVHSF